VRRRLPLLVLALALLGACGPRVAPVPEAARGQVPRAAPGAAWQGRGRLELVFPGKRISCGAIVRGLGDGSARVAFLSDEGLLLADLSLKPGAWEVITAIPDLKDALPHLGRLAAQAYAAAPMEERRWEADAIAASAGDQVRWYGGDPVLLRAVTGGGLDLLLEDWRLLGPDLVPCEVRGEGPFGITIRIHLDAASLKPGK
jgi:hypothetical protein